MACYIVKTSNFTNTQIKVFLHVPKTAIITLSRRKIFWHDITLVSFYAYTNSLANIWGSVIKQLLMAYPQNRGRRIQDTTELERQGQMP